MVSVFRSGKGIAAHTFCSVDYKREMRRKRSRDHDHVTFASMKGGYVKEFPSKICK
ncbi:unnamed protein product [Sphenostylis stenocarpa]|uniref:Uncharacterized protein n=1 Tax=Sphenostylis stenocarpa TaxID=92480 RepID=A0AA86RZ82_9FABA|nr:unnamed protein product [Sphenostylis stenocarpa]